MNKRKLPIGKYEKGGTSLVVRQVVGDIIGEDLVRGVGLNVLKRNLRVQGGAGTRDAGRGGSPSHVDDDVLIGEFHLTLTPPFSVCLLSLEYAGPSH